jgi:hypothetical protein
MQRILYQSALNFNFLSSVASKAQFNISNMVFTLIEKLPGSPCSAQRQALRFTILSVLPLFRRAR